MSSPRKQRREDKRSRILEAARRLFGERGSAEVTMAEVALAAGVARATVFNLFGSKQALLEGITENVLAHYQAMLENALADHDTPTTELLRALFEQIGIGIEEDRHFYRGAFREIAKLSLGLDEAGAGQRARQENLDGLLKLIRRGQERAELTQAHAAEDLSSAFDGMVFGTITHWLQDDASEPLDVRMKRTAEVFLGAAGLDRAGRSDGALHPVLLPQRRRRPAGSRAQPRRNT